MKIGVVSDTHGSISAIRRVLETIGPVDLWLHAGDHYWDGAVLGDLAGTPVTSVLGNCDGTAGRKIDEFIEVAGKRIWLTHGHRYQVRSGHEELLSWCAIYGADICIYGHTHVPVIENTEAVLVLNPGSPFQPRGGSKPSCALLEIAPAGQAAAHLFEVV